MKQYAIFFVGIIIAALLLAGCAQQGGYSYPSQAPATPSNPTPVPPTPPATVTPNATPSNPEPVIAPSAQAIEISNFAFSPAALTVTEGATVTWTNKDAAPHSIVSDDNSFSLERMSNGQSSSYTFTKAGIYAYHCGVHPSMKGQITVVPRG